jgi:hypothetical protein
MAAGAINSCKRAHLSIYLMRCLFEVEIYLMRCLFEVEIYLMRCLFEVEMSTACKMHTSQMGGETLSPLACSLTKLGFLFLLAARTRGCLRPARQTRQLRSGLCPLSSKSTPSRGTVNGCGTASSLRIQTFWSRGHRTAQVIYLFDLI